MKKIIIAIFVLTMMFLTACNSKNDSNNEESSSSISTTAVELNAEDSTVTFKEDETIIPENYVVNNENITSVTIPDTIVEIQQNAFYGCNITEVTIPKSVTIFDPKAFAGNPIESYNVEEGHSFLYSEDGVLYSKDSNIVNLVKYPSNKEFTGFNENVNSIGKYAFYECSKVEEVVIPDTIISIWEGTFFDCKNLTKITIPETCTTIDSFAFVGCSSLQEITIPKSVQNFGTNIFKLCDSLETITFEDGIKTIPSDNKAFTSIPNLKTVYIPESVETINSKFNSSTTIKGKAGSAAEKFAKENNLTFKQV